MTFEKIDDTILKITNKHRGMCASNISYLMATEYDSVVDEFDQQESACGNEMVAFRCGVLTEQGKLTCEIFREGINTYTPVFKHSGV